MTGALGSQEWLRLRIGVGPDLPPEATGSRQQEGAGQGLSALAHAQGGPGGLDEVLDRVATATRRIIQEGPGPAMNEFNRREQKTGQQEQGEGNRDQGLQQRPNCDCEL